VVACPRTPVPDLHHAWAHGHLTGLAITLPTPAFERRAHTCHGTVVLVTDAHAVAGARREGADAQSSEELLVLVAQGDQAAFERLYDRVAGQVLGVVRRVLRDPAQSEEVAQEVLVEVWRTAARFDADRGAAATWVLTIAHRRAVDRVRSAQAATDRDLRAAQLEHAAPYDEVSEQVQARLEREQVRHALGSLTDLQREAVQLAYYGGYTHREVAELLDVPLGTVKTRLRDGLTRLRDVLGVQA
jgi:RNA polymerase sigma-70 factor, ECF subfamily